MTEEQKPEGTPKKKGFLSIGKLLWAFIFLLAVGVCALLINVWLELQRPPPPAPPPADIKVDKIEVLSPNGAPPPGTNNGNPLIPQQPPKDEAASAENTSDDDIPVQKLPRPKKDKAKDEAREEKIPLPEGREIPLEPVNKAKPKPRADGETTLEPVNKAPAPKKEKPAARRQTELDDLF